MGARQMQEAKHQDQKNKHYKCDESLPMDMPIVILCPCYRPLIKAIQWNTSVQCQSLHIPISDLRILSNTLGLISFYRKRLQKWSRLASLSPLLGQFNQNDASISSVSCVSFDLDRQNLLSQRCQYHPHPFCSSLQVISAPFPFPPPPSTSDSWLIGCM